MSKNFTQGAERAEIGIICTVDKRHAYIYIYLVSLIHTCTCNYCFCRVPVAIASCTLLSLAASVDSEQRSAAKKFKTTALKHLWKIVFSQAGAFMI